jgi:hypothetical protein
MVPPRASRLFLGTVDGRTWQTNSEAFSVNVTAVTTGGGPAFAEVLSSGTSFRAGPKLSLGVHACNPPGGELVDLYVGALFPDGDTIVFLAAPHLFGGLGQFSAPASVAPMLALEGGGRVSAEVLDFTFPAAGIPVGTYHVFAALFRRSSLGDNALNEGDLVWLDFFPLTFAPRGVAPSRRHPPPAHRNQFVRCLMNSPIRSMACRASGKNEPKPCQTWIMSGHGS